MKSGSVALHIVKCGVSGPPETGKTHMRAIMLGKKRPRTRKSTAVATKADQVTSDFNRIYDASEDVINMTVTGKGIHKWVKVDSKGMAKFIANSLFSEECTIDSDHETDDEDSMDILIDIPSPSPPPKKRRKTVKMVDDVKKLVKSMKCRRKGLKGVQLVYFVDVGGQPQFQEILPNFIRCDFNLLVHKLSQDLEDCPEFKYIIGDESFTVPKQVQASNIDIIEQSVRSICSNMTLQSEYKPQVAIIGMFKDQCFPHPNSSDYTKILKEKSSKITARLKPYIGSEITQCELVTASREQCIFTIDGSVEGWDTNVRAIDELKERIHEYADNNSVEVPIRYFIFIQDLADYAEKHYLDYVTLEQCKSIALKGGIFMQLKDVDEALKLFYDCNTILYFPKVLPGIIFHKPAFLYGLTTDLIVASFRSENSIFNEEFQKSGVFTIDLLKKIPSLKKLGKNFKKQDFLDLLKGLFIIAELSPGRFFMPCVLSVTESSSEELAHIKECMKTNEVEGPLCISFTHKKSPRGLFCALLVALAGNCRWKLSNDHDGFFRHRNSFEFELHNERDSRVGEVIIIDKNSHLEIYTTCDRNSCLYIQKAVNEAFGKAHENLKYSKNDLDYLGFPCQILHDSSCDFHSTKVYPEVGTERCPKHRSKQIPLTSGRSVWFSSPSQSK